MALAYCYFWISLEALVKMFDFVIDCDDICVNASETVVLFHLSRCVFYHLLALENLPVSHSSTS
jgi:hypothetical protein